MCLSGRHFHCCRVQLTTVRASLLHVPCWTCGLFLVFHSHRSYCCDLPHLFLYPGAGAWSHGLGETCWLSAYRCPSALLDSAWRVPVSLRNGRVDLYSQPQCNCPLPVFSPALGFLGLRVFTSPGCAWHCLVCCCRHCCFSFIEIELHAFLKFPYFQCTFLNSFVRVN